MSYQYPLLYVYILVAVFSGLIAGVYLRDVDVVIVLAVIALIGITAIMWYMRSDDHQKDTEISGEEAQQEEVEVLSKEDARKWLDDFLVEHQKYKREE